MEERPAAWTLADHELEPRLLSASDRSDPARWKIGYGWGIDTAAQGVGMAANAWGHNQPGWPVQ